MTMGDTREIPGRDGRMSALRSLLQFRDYFGHVRSWVDKRQAEAGTPVFFAHVGMPSIVVTDVVAAAYIFAAPRDVCDRIGHMGFGTLQLRPRIIGPIQPALVARGEQNARSRRFLDAMLNDALGRFDEVLTTAVDEVAADWVSRGQVPLKEVTGIGGKVTGRWLLDIDLDAMEVAEWPKMAVTVKSSSRLVNLVLAILTRSPSSAVKTTDRLVETMRTAPRFDHVRRIGLEAGLSEADLLHQLAFLTLFNTAGLSLVMAVTLAQLALTPKWAAAIRDELGDARLKLSVMNDFPVLHKVFIECNRLFSRPKFFYREAHSDFDLPCGDGNSYRVRKGDMLLLSMRSVHYDERKFADPDTFNPERFDENPDLLRYVFIFGPHEKPYRCVSDDLRFGDVFFKYVLGRLLQGYDWEISPSPTISADKDFSPADVKLVNFRPRA